MRNMRNIAIFKQKRHKDLRLMTFLSLASLAKIPHNGFMRHLWNPSRRVAKQWISAPASGPLGACSTRC
jgi:hypothetical protein